jgi:hypothetical protein
MDSEILFWLFLAAIYILQALASKKKKPGQQPADTTLEGQQRMPSELEEALGEIGRVLRGEVDDVPTPAPAPAPVPTPARTPVPSTAPTSAPKPQRPTQTQRPLKPNEKRSARPVFYDQAFEDQKGETFKAPVITHDHVFAFSDPDEKQPSTPRVERPDLRDHLVSRQSFIAAELLAPPLSKRGRRR